MLKYLLDTNMMAIYVIKKMTLGIHIEFPARSSFSDEYWELFTSDPLAIIKTQQKVQVADTQGHSEHFCPDLNEILFTFLTKCRLLQKKQFIGFGSRFELEKMTFMEYSTFCNYFGYCQGAYGNIWG